MDDDHLTETNPDLVKFRRTTWHGMAHWAGTGPPGTNCGDCAHFVDVPCARGEYHRCRMYLKLMGRYGEDRIPAPTASCRHFEER